MLMELLILLNTTFNTYQKCNCVPDSDVEAKYNTRHMKTLTQNKKPKTYTI